MGIIKDVRIKTAAAAAAEAAAAGRGVLVYRQNIPTSKGGWSGAIPEMGEVIEAIEWHGWMLAQMAFDGQSSNGGCIMIFRRNA